MGWLKNFPLSPNEMKEEKRRKNNDGRCLQRVIQAVSFQDQCHAFTL